MVEGTVRQPRTRPAQRRRPLDGGNTVAHRGDVGALVVGAHPREHVGVRPPVGHDLGARLPRCFHGRRRGIIDIGVQQHRRPDAKFLQAPNEPEAADPVSIVAPGGVHPIRLRRAGEEIFRKAQIVRVLLDAIAI